MDKKQIKAHIRPIIGITLVSLLICGFLYPLLITGIGQVFFPYQANGDIVTINGQPVGSELIAQQFSSPSFFHTRNETAMPSASGVDPDILLDDAYSQIPMISNATGISAESLTSIVNQHQEGAFWIFGTTYINVLNVNLQLMNDYPSVYSNFTG
jgi:potassium-transporting ATPase KdpC subunit